MGQAIAKIAVSVTVFAATYVATAYGVKKFDDWLKDRKAAKAA